jgi:hypothetical protein
MWFSSFWPSRWPWISTEHPKARGSARRPAVFRAWRSEFRNHRLPGTCARLPRRSLVSGAFKAAVNLFWMVAGALVLFAPVVALMWARAHTNAPTQVRIEPPGSGIVVRSEVIAIWMPRALRDLAMERSGLAVAIAPEALEADLARKGWRPAWYALSYRAHQVNGKFAEITQIRRLSGVPDHLDELEAVMAMAAGKPPRFGDRDFSHASVEIIPETLQGVDPRAAIDRLLSERLGDGIDLRKEVDIDQ